MSILQLFEIIKNSNEYIDININLPVIDEGYYECLNINNMIRNNNNCTIDFSEKSIMYPHITLKMGRVKIEDLEVVFSILNEYFKDIKKMSFIGKNIIIKKPNKKYYFCEINDQRLMKISTDLNEILDQYMNKPEFLLNEKNLHHITLGNKDKTDIEINEVLDMKIENIITDKVCVSIKGKNGTCLGIIKTFYLK